MKRRDAMRLAIGAVAVGGAGYFTIAEKLKPNYTANNTPQKLTYKPTPDDWKYHTLDPKKSAEIAYQEYSNGSCMYATFKAIITQLAEQYGQPYASYPIHMMKYGHGGIAGFGSTCGTVNGAAALFGLFINDKKLRDKLVTELFRWYEQTPFPIHQPKQPKLEANMPTSVAQSVLCHASLTNWTKASGEKAHDKVRKERCRRLSADVAYKATEMLNALFKGEFVATHTDSQVVGSCMACHGSEGKLDNTSGKMNCSSCHSESLAHKAFAGPHYKIME